MNNRLSLCCGERLTHYDEKWDDGICSKCEKHTARKYGKHDEKHTEHCIIQ